MFVEEAAEYRTTGRLGFRQGADRTYGTMDRQDGKDVFAALRALDS